MTFKELHPDIQRIAAHALRHHVESGYHEDGKSVGVAKEIKAAFVELFSDDSSNDTEREIEEKIANTAVFNVKAMVNTDCPCRCLKCHGS
ncbi:hypothetical protein MUU49_19510 [Scandinavium goeteborgense]|uniref:hypothetical protein n=1 Tax=Scandinavium goeteborgense TaxID=1851514 RepID=UPI0021656B89|nr:hypothetical protein [Scandinavium goeteborgense]MCS2154743.1 hypothetical protein [Scandinavium goeteborgense]